MPDIHLTKEQVVHELTKMLQTIYFSNKDAITSDSKQLVIEDKSGNEITLVFPKKFNKQDKLQELYSEKHKIIN